jgi:hypothetical protein
MVGKVYRLQIFLNIYEAKGRLFRMLVVLANPAMPLMVGILTVMVQEHITNLAILTR